MVWPPDTTTSTPRLFSMAAFPSPGATATKPRGFVGSGCASGAGMASSLAILRARSCDCRSMLCMKTSDTCPRSRKYFSTWSGWLECTCTLNLGAAPTHSSQSPIVCRKSSASSASRTSESTRNSLQ